MYITQGSSSFNLRLWFGCCVINDMIVTFFFCECASGWLYLCILKSYYDFVFICRASWLASFICRIRFFCFVLYLSIFWEDFQSPLPFFLLLIIIWCFWLQRHNYNYLRTAQILKGFSFSFFVSLSQLVFLLHLQSRKLNYCGIFFTTLSNDFQF